MVASICPVAAAAESFFFSPNSRPLRFLEQSKIRFRAADLVLLLEAERGHRTGCCCCVYSFLYIPAETMNSIYYKTFLFLEKDIVIWNGQADVLIVSY